jgi:antitoxin VapB
VGLNIKNAETERLIRELAEATGENLTTALTTAVRERLERVQASDAAVTPRVRAERILALGDQIASRLTGPFATQEHGDLLYDERGLPT